MSNNKKKHLPSPPVVSTACSKCRSYLSLRRHLSPLPPPPPLPKPNSNKPSSSAILPRPTHLGNGKSAAEAYWTRVRQLELELDQLDKWLSTEKSFRDSLTRTTDARETSLVEKELTLRLADGSYLRRIRRPSRPSERLVMHVSAPAIAETGSTAYEVLRNMASMGMKDLFTCLLESMPMCNISGYKMAEMRGKPIPSGSEAGFMEAIVLGAMEKMEGLAMEGLRIQIGGNNASMVEISEWKEMGRREECIVLVTLVQIRDATDGYEAVGELMIGLVEASAAEVITGESYSIAGVHVAGMKRTGKGMVGREGFMWSASVKGCRVGCCCCMKYVRNPNIFCHAGM